MYFSSIKIPSLSKSSNNRSLHFSDKEYISSIPLSFAASTSEKQSFISYQYILLPPFSLFNDNIKKNFSQLF